MIHNRENVLIIDSQLRCRKKGYFLTFEMAVEYMNKYIPVNEPTVFFFLPGLYTFSPIYFEKREIYLQSLTPHSVTLQGVIYVTNCKFSMNEFQMNLTRVVVNITEVKSFDIYFSNLEFTTVGFVGKNNYDHLIEVHVSGLQLFEHKINVQIDNVLFKMKYNDDYIPKGATIFLEASLECKADTQFTLNRISGTSIWNNDQNILETININNVVISDWDTFHETGLKKGYTLSLNNTRDVNTVQNCVFRSFTLVIQTTQSESNFTGRQFFRNSSITGVVEFQNCIDIKFIQCTLTAFFEESYILYNNGIVDIGTLFFQSCDLLNSNGSLLQNKHSDLSVINSTWKASGTGIISDQSNNISLNGTTITTDDTCIGISGDGDFKSKSSTFASNGVALKVASRMLSIVGSVIERSTKAIVMTTSPQSTIIDSSNFTASDVVIESTSPNETIAETTSTNFQGYAIVASSEKAQLKVLAASSNIFQGQKTVGKAIYEQKK